MEPIRIRPVRTKSERTPVRGFTLVEMMVVLFIIVIVTTVAVMGQSTFNRSLILTDTAYTIAFAIREAQTYGLSSRVINNAYNAGYGVRFEIATPNSFVFFADTWETGAGDDQDGYCPGHSEPADSPDSHPGNCIYDDPAYFGQDPATPELMRTYTLNRGFVIYQFCGRAQVGGVLRCSGEDFESMHITFMRPSTDSTIFGRMSDGSLIALSDATIYLRSPDAAAERCIFVSKVGQIGVDVCP